MIRSVDSETGRRPRFLTNNTLLDAGTVALLYRKRWKIELFFKWVKQHLHIKAFFGTSPNAVKAQLWAAVIAYVLVVRLKHRHGLSRETNDILQILSVTILEKTPIFELCSRIGPQSSHEQSANQLALFEL